MPKSENEVEAEVIAWMRARGWKAMRQNRGVLRTSLGATYNVGAPGQCDWRFERAVSGKGESYWLPALFQVCEFEAKAEGKGLFPGNKRDKQQLEYIAKRTHYENCPSRWANSLDMWKEWYEGIFSN